MTPTIVQSVAENAARGFRWWNHPTAEPTEDTLTAHVFALGCYEPAFLGALLGRIQELNADRLSALGVELTRSGKVAVQPWPSWPVPQDLVSTVTKLNRADGAKLSVIPDVVIRDVSEAKRWLLIVEAEDSIAYHSEQFIEQYLVGRRRAEAEGTQLLLLLANRTLCRPSGLATDLRSFDRVLGGSGISAADVDRRLLWIGWPAIAGLIRECLDADVFRSRALALETLGLLEHRGYTAVVPPHDDLRRAQADADVVGAAGSQLQERMDTRIGAAAQAATAKMSRGTGFLRALMAALHDSDESGAGAAVHDSCSAAAAGADAVRQIHFQTGRKP